MTRINTILTVGYIIIQSVIALSVSIAGAIHVRRCTQQHKAKQSKLNQSIELTIKNNTENKTANKTENNPSNTNETKEAEIDDPFNDTHPGNDGNSKQKSFCELWVKTTWKMRGVYSGLTVHSFDVLTDILVILQWIQTDDVEGDNIDPKVMAYSAISVLLFSKIVSAVAIYAKERDIVRCILQIFDLLIFYEIYESHQKVVSQIKNKTIKDKNNAIESTLSFKYIRSMEAIFESIPQSVLQLVYVMRTTSIEPIFVVSIMQSIVSMTNSVLNNDYTRMQEKKFDKYKKRLPPTFAFFKHGLVRLAEVSYRIGLLALFWTVCEGLAFGIMVAIELLLIFGKLFMDIRYDDAPANADTILLEFNALILIPSEQVYGESFEWAWLFGVDADRDDIMVLLILNCCCCAGVSALLASLPAILCNRCLEDAKEEIGGEMAMRIGKSLMEFVFLIIWAFFGDDGHRKEFLFEFKHGAGIFIASCIFFIIYSQYNALFPDFALPLDVSARSKWGYAFSNELTELKKIKVPLKKMPYIIKYKIKDGSSREMTIKNQTDFWDEPYDKSKEKTTAAVFALAKDNKDIIEWLEDKGAVVHQTVDREEARKLLELTDDDD